MLQQLEQMRKRAVLYYLLLIPAVLLSVILIFLIAPLGVLCLIAGVSVLLSLGSKAHKKYVRAFKKLIVEDSFQKSFDKVRYVPGRGLSRKVIEETGMIYTGNRYSSDDYVSGSYKGVSFVRSDVCIQNVQRTGKTTVTVTYFNGKWMIFDFNKRFVNDLQVLERGFRYSRKTGGLFSGKPRMHKLETEDAAFNRAFRVNAVSDHEAFYILTPHFMESLRRISAKINGELLLCFIDSYLHIAVNTGSNALEAPMFTKINPDTAFGSTRREIALIRHLVDELKLNNNIFKG